MGGTISNGRNNDELVDNLVDADYLKSVKLQQIFRAVDRGDYYTAGQREKAYRDSAWRSGNLHLSAPCVYSEVMEALKLKSGLSFLNLGSGSGYLSTMAGLILGTYGINHGIELFPDVVTFANTQLNEFVSKSEAIDEYEFCVPTFVVGNCLRVDSSSQLYDRVYCGASCPEEHEIYMKHLIKVGGILVMPLNNKLLQITRTGESTWESTKVLSVSFAPLYPLEAEPLTLVNLPDFSPPTLQESCRSVIRVILRSRVEKEHPSLQEKKSHSSKSRDKGQIRRIVIPLMDHSDSGNSNSDNDDNDSDNSPKISVDPSVKSRTTAFIENFMRGRAEIQEVVAGPSNWKVDAAAEKEEESSPPAPKKKEDESDDSAMSTDDEGRPSSSGFFCSASFISESRDSSDAAAAAAPSPKKRVRKRRNGVDQGGSRRKKRVLSHLRLPLKLRRRTATFIWKRIIPGETSTASDNEEKADAPVKDSNEQNTVNYRDLLAEKVLALPLPTPILRYINYRRENI